MSNARQQNTEDELEIDLNDIIGFFVTYWKFFAMGIIFGFVTGIVGTRLLFSKYEAEAIISNESVGISYSVWAELKRELPILAFQISASEKNSESFFNARFLTPASIVIDKNLDGLSAIAELEEIESGLRKGTSRSDSNDIEILNDITYSLKKIRAAFPPELAEPNLISISKPYHAKYIVIGLASGFLLALLGSFFSAIWLRYRRNIAVTGNATFIRPCTTQPATPIPSNTPLPEN